MSTVHPDRNDTGRAAARRIKTPLARLAFYSAIGLPAVYLPLLATGIETTDGLVVFLGLFALHVATLVGGRPYISEP